jgi:signal transduction histidine kinase/ActR/RegA family two-component response regulator
MRPQTRPLYLRYGCAVVSVALATASRSLLDPALGDHQPFAPYFLAVIFTAWYGGFGPSLVALVLGGVVGSYLFVPPRGSFAIVGVEHQVGMLLYLCVGLACAAFSEALQTARRRAEAGAAEASRHREWLRVLLAGVGDAVLAADAHGYVTFLNPAAESLLGWTLDEAVGRELADLLDLRDEETGTPVDGPAARYCPGAGASGLCGDSVAGLEGPTRLVIRDGSVRLVEQIATPLRDERRQSLGVVLVLRDVTEKRQAERAARFLADAGAVLAAVGDYEDTLQKVARLAVPFFADWCAVDMAEPDGSLRRLAVAHPDPRQVEVVYELNRRYPPDPDVAGGPRYVFRTGRPDLMPDVTDAMLARAAKDAEHLRLLRALGLRSYLAVPLTASGKTLGVLTFGTAESGRRYGEADLALAEELAHRAAVALENAHLYRELREADRRKDEFLATLAHELRNPLATVRNALHVLQLPGVDDASAARAREMMGRQVEQLVRLVDDLLDVSRVMHGRIALRRERVGVAAVLTRAVETARPAIDAAGHELTVALPAEPVWVDADVVRLTQVVGNLLHNAAKYTERGGRISLGAGREGDEAVIRVRDTGIGIRPDMLSRIFDLFVQTDRAADRSQGGLGIGLTLVRRLVEMHGGRVQALSDGPGTGSAFVVRLPARPAACEGPPASGPPAPAAVPRRRVLVVDDNADAAESLAMLLRLEGQEVRVAHDGPAALEAARAERPNVIFLDIGMPGMDGYEVCRRLRQESGLNGAVLVAVTGWGQEEDRRRGQEAGFDRHLVKPVGMEVLQQVLAGLAVPHAPSPGAGGLSPGGAAEGSPGRVCEPGG